MTEPEERKRRLPSWYAWATLVALTTASVGLNVIISQNTARRTVQQAQEQSRRNSAAALAAFCLAAETQEQVFADAEGEVGRNAAKAWHDLGVTFGCH